MDDTKEIPAESIALKFHQVWFMGKAQKKAESVFPTTHLRMAKDSGKEPRETSGKDTRAVTADR